MFLSETCFGTKFREFASIFVPRNRISSCFLFCAMVQNGILSVCFYFCSMVQNSQQFSPLGNGSEQNFACFLCTEQQEICRNKPIVPSIPSSVEIFFVGNCQPYSQAPLLAKHTTTINMIMYRIVKDSVLHMFPLDCNFMKLQAGPGPKERPAAC
jgi:hypothetical protein